MNLNMVKELLPAANWVSPTVFPCFDVGSNSSRELAGHA